MFPEPDLQVPCSLYMPPSCPGSPELKTCTLKTTPRSSMSEMLTRESNMKGRKLYHVISVSVTSVTAQYSNKISQFQECCRQASAVTSLSIIRIFRTYVAVSSRRVLRFSFLNFNMIELKKINSRFFKSAKSKCIGNYSKKGHLGLGHSYVTFLYAQHLQLAQALRGCKLRALSAARSQAQTR